MLGYYRIFSNHILGSEFTLQNLQLEDHTEIYFHIFAFLAYSSEIKINSLNLLKLVKFIPIITLSVHCWHVTLSGG